MGDHCNSKNLIKGALRHQGCHYIMSNWPFNLEKSESKSPGNWFYFKWMDPLNQGQDQAILRGKSTEFLLSPEKSVRVLITEFLANYLFTLYQSSLTSVVVNTIYSSFLPI